MLGGAGDLQHPPHHHPKPDDDADAAERGAEAFGDGVDGLRGAHAAGNAGDGGGDQHGDQRMHAGAQHQKISANTATASPMIGVYIAMIIPALRHVVADKGADRLLEAFIGDEAQVPRPLGIELARPASDDAVDGGVRLESYPCGDDVTGHRAQRFEHLPARAR